MKKTIGSLVLTSAAYLAAFTANATVRFRKGMVLVIK